MNSHDNPERHRPVHPPLMESPNRSVIVFLTICTKDRQKLLATPAMHDVLRDAWCLADHWLAGRYVLMPDHVHLFCAPGILPAKPLTNWVRHWKAAVCKAAVATAGTFWQRDYWDTQLCQRESYAAKWEYVRQNPVRAGLVSRPDDWPHQGEMNILRWHE